MPSFLTLPFRRTPASQLLAVAVHDLSDDVRLALPMRFEAVGEALVSETDVIAA